MKYLRTTPGAIPIRSPDRVHTSNPPLSRKLLNRSIIDSGI